MAKKRIKNRYVKECDHCERKSVFSFLDGKTGKMVGVCQRHWDKLYSRNKRTKGSRGRRRARPSRD